MQKIKRFLSENLFPKEFTCDICLIETFGANLCPDCKKTVKFNNKATCPVCGRRTIRPEICLECKAKPPLFKKAVSPLVYEDGALQLIAKYKNGYAYLKEYFADLLTEALKTLPEYDCIVYVPMTPESVKARGYNQVELLARALSERIKIPVIYDAVIKTRKNKIQKGLARAEREENVKNCFKVVKADEIKEKNVLILDDVLTTGATADEMCRQIKASGAKQIYFATIASVEYKTLPAPTNKKQT